LLVSHREGEAKPSREEDKERENIGRSLTLVPVATSSREEQSNCTDSLTLAECRFPAQKKRGYLRKCDPYRGA